MIRIERTKPEQIAYVADNLLPSDILEIRRAGLDDYKEAVRESVKVSAFAFTALHNGVPVCLFGLRPDGIMSARARVWMLSTPEIYKSSREFIRAARTVVSGLLDLYPVLYNAVDAHYPRAKRLLRFLGASFGREIKSPAGFTFIHFQIRRTK